MAYSVASLNKHKIKPFLIVPILLFILCILQKISTCFKCFSFARNKINRENGNGVFVFFILFSFHYSRPPGVSSKRD